MAADPRSSDAADVVEWGDEFPAEIDSIWTTESEAQKRCNELNEDDVMKGHGGNWNVRRWPMRVTWEPEA